jgi:MOSC domain-containing protein YiiM
LTNHSPVVADQVAGAHLRHIFTAPRRGAPIVELQEVEALTDCGLRGDHHAAPSARKRPDSQVTLIELERIEAFARETGKPLAPGDPRRNLVTAGVRLNELLGRRFAVGDVELEGLELCEPCSLFAKRTYPEVVHRLVHGGGLRCRILRGGTIRVGDPVTERG